MIVHASTHKTKENKKKKERKKRRIVNKHKKAKIYPVPVPVPDRALSPQRKQTNIEKLESEPDVIKTDKSIHHKKP